MIALGFFFQVAAVQYNNRVTPLWDFTNSTSVEELMTRIDAIQRNGEGTLTGRALAFVASHTLQEINGNRRDVPDIVFLLTDGEAQDNPEATVQVKL